MIAVPPHVSPANRRLYRPEFGLWKPDCVVRCFPKAIGPSNGKLDKQLIVNGRPDVGILRSDRRSVCLHGDSFRGGADL
jgi:hypothetical protein